MQTEHPTLLQQATTHNDASKATPKFASSESKAQCHDMLGIPAVVSCFKSPPYFASKDGHQNKSDRTTVQEITKLSHKRTIWHSPSNACLAVKACSSSRMAVQKKLHSSPVMSFMTSFFVRICLCAGKLLHKEVQGFHDSLCPLSRRGL